MSEISRREFCFDAISGFVTLALVSSLCDAQAIKGSVKPVAHKWLSDMDSLCNELRSGKVAPTGWQDGIESLLSRVEMPDLFKAIDFDRLSRTTTLYADHETAEELNFARIKGAPRKPGFAPFFYGMKKGVSIVPHGHQNMASMHMILKGEAHGRHFDRISDEPKFMTIKPTKDKSVTVGDVTTISSDRDNIHWFRSTSETVFMFNIGVYPLDPNADTTGRDYVDPERGEKLGDGSLRVPRLSAKAAYKIYGRS